MLSKSITSRWKISPCAALTENNSYRHLLISIDRFDPYSRHTNFSQIPYKSSEIMLVGYTVSRVSAELWANSCRRVLSSHYDTVGAMRGTSTRQSFFMNVIIIPAESNEGLRPNVWADQTVLECKILGNA